MTIILKLSIGTCLFWSDLVSLEYYCTRIYLWTSFTGSTSVEEPLHPPNFKVIFYLIFNLMFYLILYLLCIHTCTYTHVTRTQKLSCFIYVCMYVYIVYIGYCVPIFYVTICRSCLNLIAPILIICLNAIIIIVRSLHPLQYSTFYYIRRYNGLFSLCLPPYCSTILA